MGIGVYRICERGIYHEAHEEHEEEGTKKGRGTGNGMRRKERRVTGVLPRRARRTKRKGTKAKSTKDTKMGRKNGPRNCTELHRRGTGDLPPFGRLRINSGHEGEEHEEKARRGTGFHTEERKHGEAGDFWGGLRPFNGRALLNVQVGFYGSGLFNPNRTRMKRIGRPALRHRGCGRHWHILCYGFTRIWSREWEDGFAHELHESARIGASRKNRSR
jgi:hypothetical protein